MAFSLPTILCHFLPSSEVIVPISAPPTNPPTSRSMEMITWLKLVLSPQHSAWGKHCQLGNETGLWSQELSSSWPGGCSHLRALSSQAQQLSNVSGPAPTTAERAPALRRAQFEIGPCPSRAPAGTCSPGRLPNKPSPKEHCLRRCINTDCGCGRWSPSRPRGRLSEGRGRCQGDS